MNSIKGTSNQLTPEFFLCAVIAIPPNIVARIICPHQGKSGTSLSELPVITICMFELLPAGDGFGKSEVTLADRVSVATPLFNSISISNETFPPFAITPDKQVTVVVVAEHPAGPETKLAPVGRDTVVTTLVADCGPALVILKVYPAILPVVKSDGPEMVNDNVALAAEFKLQFKIAFPATPFSPSIAISYSVPAWASNSRLLLPPAV